MRHLLPRRDRSILAHWQQQQLCLLLPEEEEVGDALGTTWTLQRASSMQLFLLISPKGLLSTAVQPSLLQGLLPFVAMKHHVHVGWWLERSVSVSVLVTANHKWHIQTLHPDQFWPHSKMPEHSCLSLSQRDVKQNYHKPQTVSAKEILQNSVSAHELGKYNLSVCFPVQISPFREKDREARLSPPSRMMKSPRMMISTWTQGRDLNSFCPQPSRALT